MMIFFNFFAAKSPFCVGISMGRFREGCWRTLRKKGEGHCEIPKRGGGGQVTVELSGFGPGPTAQRPMAGAGGVKWEKGLLAGWLAGGCVRASAHSADPAINHPWGFISTTDVPVKQTNSDAFGMQPPALEMRRGPAAISRSAAAHPPPGASHDFPMRKARF